MANTQTQSNTATPAEQKQRDIKATVIRVDPQTGAVTTEGEAVGLRLDFSNGRALTLTVDQLTSAIREEATVHGLKQKLVDAAAISRDPKTGKSATIDDKYDAVRKVFQRLLSGEWNEAREGGGAGSLLFRALCRMTPDKTPAEVREWLDARSDAEKKGLELNPKVASIISAIRAEQLKAGADIDSDAILATLK